MYVSLLPSSYSQVIFCMQQKTGGFLIMLSRSALVDLHHLHGQGDVVEVGVGQGGQEADAQTD